jgi:hypothetical protein
MPVAVPMGKITEELMNALREGLGIGVRDG